MSGVATSGAYLPGLPAATRLGILINEDPDDPSSDVAKKIFRALTDIDISSAVAFSQTSMQLNARAKQKWFVKNCKEIILKYIQQGTFYGNYDQRWLDGLKIGVDVIGIGLTIGAGIQASIHASRIPEDAPITTHTYLDDYGMEHVSTCVDHPEARKAAAWMVTAGVAGSLTVISLGFGMYRYLKNVDLDIFFSRTEEEILGPVSRNLGITIVSPEFHGWKLAKMKEQLCANPAGWEAVPQLTHMICPLSHDFMLFPVKDKCGHYFDYRSVRGLQLDPGYANPLQCPLNGGRADGLSELKFDRRDSIEFRRSS